MPANSTQLDCHPASDAEREAAYRNVHDVWSKGLPLEEHVRRRLASPSHRRAQWFVGCLDGEVVTSLGSYPLSFRVAGQSVAGMAVGSVHTLAAFRRQGLAPQLLAYVEQYERRRGVALSLLYSDIDPEFYARLGYRLCPSYSGWCELRGKRAPIDAKDAVEHLEPFVPWNGLGRMMGLYEAYHGALPIAIERTPEYWQSLNERRPDDEFFWLSDGAGVTQGYLRVTSDGESLRVSDYALIGHDPALASRLYHAFIGLGHVRGAMRVGGWLPHTDTAKSHFRIEQRGAEITMLKPLSDEIELTDEQLASTDRFAEIDHV